MGYDLHADTFFLGVTPIDYSLAYVDSGQKTSEGTKTKAQDEIVAIEAITIEVNDANVAS